MDFNRRLIFFLLSVAAVFLVLGLIGYGQLP